MESSQILGWYQTVSPMQSRTECHHFYLEIVVPSSDPSRTVFAVAKAVSRAAFGGMNER